jgi:hypothetical protein
MHFQPAATAFASGPKEPIPTARYSGERVTQSGVEGAESWVRSDLVLEADGRFHLSEQVGHSADDGRPLTSRTLSGHWMAGGGTATFNVEHVTPAAARDALPGLDRTFDVRLDDLQSPGKQFRVPCAEAPLHAALVPDFLKML